MSNPPEANATKTDAQNKKDDRGADIFYENVKEHAPPPLESEGVEIEKLKGGCRGSTCSASSSLWARLQKEQPWAEAEARVVNADDEVLEYILDHGKGFVSEITQIQLCRNIQKLTEVMEDPRTNKTPEHLRHKASALKELRDSMDHPACIVNPPQDSSS